MKIQIGDYLIRDWTERDAASLSQHANNHKIWLNVLDSFPHPFTLDNARAWIARTAAASPATSFALAHKNEAFGNIGFVLQEDVYRKTAKVGYWLGEAYWGRGIATSALRAITDYAFQYFDLCHLYTGVFAWNKASMLVLEKAGYALEGVLRNHIFKDGQVVDEYIYGRIK